MSLTRTAKNTKLAFTLVIGLMLLYLFGAYVMLPMSKQALKSLFPPRNPPNPAFGILEPIRFESLNILGTSNPKYTLLTTDGRLPRDIPDRMTVYRYKPPLFSYEAGKRASDDAGKLGFSDASLTTSFKEDEYRWVDPSTRSDLVINIRSYFLEKNTPITSIANVYTPGSISRTKAISEAKSILRSIERFSDPLYEDGSENVNLGIIRGREIRYTTFHREVEIARVDFFRSIRDFPIVGPKHEEGLIYIYVAEAPRENPILRSPYIYYNVRSIETESRATYPIIPVSVAWEQVSSHRGAISRVRPSDKSIFEEYKPVNVREILITDIYLAYYDDTEDQDYLQPIYVFEGNYTGVGEEKGVITIYYPALASEYISTDSNN